MSDWCSDCQQRQGYHTAACKELRALRAAIEVEKMGHDHTRHCLKLRTAERDRAATRVRELERVIEAASDWVDDVLQHYEGAPLPSEIVGKNVSAALCSALRGTTPPISEGKP